MLRGDRLSERPAAAVGEVCFNTAMTGYEEILTDPSYSGQIITFTFPHVGNVGTNEEDIETDQHGGLDGHPGRDPARARSPSRRTIAPPATSGAGSRRAASIGLGGIDTRALTALIRDKGMPNAVIAHDPDGSFDIGRRSSGRPPPGTASRARISCPTVTHGPAIRLGRDGLDHAGQGYGHQGAPQATRSWRSTTG